MNEVSIKLKAKRCFEAICDEINSNERRRTRKFIDFSTFARNYGIPDSTNFMISLSNMISSSYKFDMENWMNTTFIDIYDVQIYNMIIEYYKLCQSSKSLL